MQVDILTIFPRLFDSMFRYGIINQARKKDLLQIEIIDLRSYTTDPHRTVDDRPYGGGAGMVLKPEPIFAALKECRADSGAEPYVILMTPKGPVFDQAKAKELSLKPRLTVLCGRYEGVDQRVVDHLVDAEISIGDYVLSGGEFPAAVIVDAVARLLPGALGEAESALSESFMEGLLDYPQYTRPEEFQGWRVPEVLLSGDHREIERWRKEKAFAITRERRPDLLQTEAEKKGEDE